MHGMPGAWVVGVGGVRQVRALLEGQPQSIDLLSIAEGSKGRRDVLCHDAHMLSWAIIGQHDMLAERTFRWIRIKALKEWLCAISVIALRSTWFGTIELLPAAVSEDERREQHYDDPAALPQTTLDKGAGGSDGGGGGGSAWRRISGPLRFCCITNLSWASHDVCFCPGLEPGAGHMDLLIARTPSRWELLKGFLAMETGAHVTHRSFERYRVSAVRLSAHGRGGEGTKAESPLQTSISGERYLFHTADIKCKSHAAVFWF